MTVGVGGSTVDAELAALSSMRGAAPAITDVDRARRIERVQALMREWGIAALWLDVSASLTYFTGLRLHRSERLHGAVLPARGEIVYLCPAFEEAKLRTMITLGDKVATWEEHEDPTALVTDILRGLGLAKGTIAIDEATQFAAFDGLRRAGNSYDFVNGARVTSACRAIKSDRELALMQTAKDITLRAHRAAARILRDGITTTEVQAFLVAAHARLGAEGPPAFNIVLFGEATAYPHGVPYPQTLAEGDMVLIDVGAPVDGYVSDITRSYVFGTPSARQREIWNLEKAAQAAAFAAAQVGTRCEAVDAAARGVIEAAGARAGLCRARPAASHGPRHRPRGARSALSREGRPHRAGAGDGTFSNEPMICLSGEFGVRLEDHFYMTAQGPRWFTRPAHSIDDPFGYEATAP
jgi:Xaa-Pro dipeptidase